MELPLPIGFLGAGNMAEALLGGILNKKLARPEQVWVSDVRAARLEELKSRYGVCPASGNAELMRQCQTVVFSIKPQNVKDVGAEIGALARKDVLYITICAGVGTRVFERLLTGAEGAARVVRVMPNTPALIGCGASALAGGAHVLPGDLTAARLLFDAVGVSAEVEEGQLDAVTGLTGSGPAYIFLMIETLIEAGVEQGLSAETSERLVKQMVFGSARLAFESPQTPAELRQAVTSPGGTTAAGLEALRQGDFASLIRRCVARATEKEAANSAR